MELDSGNLVQESYIKFVKIKFKKKTFEKKLFFFRLFLRIMHILG